MKNNSLSLLLTKVMKDKGFPDPKACARAVGLPYELFRKVLIEGHIPRDEQILLYGDKLGIDKGKLIRLAHYERAHKLAKQYLEDLLVEQEISTHSVEQRMGRELNEDERELIEKLLKILTSDRAHAVQGIKSSIEAFYQMTIPLK